MYKRIIIIIIGAVLINFSRTFFHCNLYKQKAKTNKQTTNKQKQTKKTSEICFLKIDYLMGSAQYSRNTHSTSVHMLVNYSQFRP